MLQSHISGLLWENRTSKKKQNYKEPTVVETAGLKQAVCRSTSLQRHSALFRKIASIFK